MPNAPELLAKLVADTHPRVRLEALRALAKIPSAKSAELSLSVLDRPMDPTLDYALWLTINDLAEPWIAAVQSGEWKPEGREKQLEFGLKAIKPEQASRVLGQILATRPLTRDGQGPWIEMHRRRRNTEGAAPAFRSSVERRIRRGCVHSRAQVTDGGVAPSQAETRWLDCRDRQVVRRIFGECHGCGADAGRRVERPRPVFSEARRNRRSAGLQSGSAWYGVQHPAGHRGQGVHAGARGVDRRRPQPDRASTGHRGPGPSGPRTGDAACHGDGENHDQ